MILRGPVSFLCQPLDNAGAKMLYYSSIKKDAGLAHLVERHLAKVKVASSSLVTRSTGPKGPVLIGSIAQLGEHLPYKQRVTGSSPVVSTKNPRCVSSGGFLFAICAAKPPVSGGRFRTLSAPALSGGWSKTAGRAGRSLLSAPQWRPSLRRRCTGGEKPAL